MGKIIKALEEEVASRKEKLTTYHAYEPEEELLLNGEPLFSVLDFWKYAYSQLKGTAGALGEFFVARALGIEKAEIVDYWTAYDMAYRNKRIEVKSTQYVHTWNKEISETRVFSIEPSNNGYWTSAGIDISNGGKKSRQSEVYVFCINENKDIENDDPLRVDDWMFYVVPTFVINNYCIGNPGQKKIAFSVVRKLCKEGVRFNQLKAAVDEAIDSSDAYYERL